MVRVLILVSLLAVKSCSQPLCPKTEAQFGRFMFPCYNMVGRSCTYNCYSDSYPPRLVSSSRVTCTATGAWSGNLECSGASGSVEAVPEHATERAVFLSTTRRTSEASVSVKCPDLNPPDHGYVEKKCSNARDGDTCVFGCMTGFVTRGFSSITCRWRKWDSEPAVCVRQDCPELIPPGNGTLKGMCKTAQTGQVCVYACNPGYLPVDEDTRMLCTATGWSKDDPRCSQVKCKPIEADMIENAFLEGDCNPGVGLAFCSIWCRKGYALSGKSLMYCSMDGVWLPSELPSCIKLSDGRDQRTTSLPQSISTTAPQKINKQVSTSMSTASFTATPSTILVSVASSSEWTSSGSSTLPNVPATTSNPIVSNFPSPRPNRQAISASKTESEPSPTLSVAQRRPNPTANSSAENVSDSRDIDPEKTAKAAAITINNISVSRSIVVNNPQPPSDRSIASNSTEQNDKKPGRIEATRRDQNLLPNPQNTIADRAPQQGNSTSTPAPLSNSSLQSGNNL